MDPDSSLLSNMNLNVHINFGSIFIGSALSFFLYGITCCQVSSYFSLRSSDQIWMKSLVGVITLILFPLPDLATRRFKVIRRYFQWRILQRKIYLADWTKNESLPPFPSNIQKETYSACVHTISSWLGMKFRCYPPMLKNVPWLYATCVLHYLGRDYSWNDVLATL
ncbi:hypothetical protein BDQ17DRAFT_1499538 [Cyathus striatus]|nr:hypothetical protein BDQ17DRAFT_1499538 [Cyathus striatus]